MFKACRHIKTNGLRCQSPAFNGGHFCYYHSRTRTVGVDVKFGPLLLPTPEDPAAIQLSVARINEAVLTGRLDLRKAASLFAGLKIAARFIDCGSYSDEADPVESSEQAANGEEIAPDHFVCDDDEDCSDCLYTKLCPRCIHPDEEDDKEGEHNDKSVAAAPDLP